MPYYDNFWHIDACETIAYLFDSLYKIENWEPTYQICYCLLSSRQQRKMWNSCCNARPQTSSLKTYGLLTVLTLTLWITGYVEYCSTCLSEIKSVKNWMLMNWNCVWLKRGLALVSLDHAIDQRRVHLKAKWKQNPNLTPPALFYRIFLYYGVTWSRKVKLVNPLRL